jgi:uncharacterized repeat protein (TIGR01451 family)
VTPTTLKVTKLAPRGVRAKRRIAFRIVIANTGSALAKNVVIVDRIPAGLALVRLPKGATLSGGVLRWRIGDLAPGRRIQVGFWTVSTRARRVCNTASASAGNAPSARGSACVRVIVVRGVSAPPRVTG